LVSKQEDEEEGGGRGRGGDGDGDGGESLSPLLSSPLVRGGAVRCGEGKENHNHEILRCKAVRSIIATAGSG
jgi:hypothetical protein